MPQQTLAQFGQTIKAKHPEYADMADEDVGSKVLAKYPQYQDMVSSQDPVAGAGSLGTPQPPAHPAVDMQPSIIGPTSTASPMQRAFGANPIGDAVSVVGQHIKNLATAPFQEPQNIPEAIAGATVGPSGLGAARAVGQSVGSLGKSFRSLGQGDYAVAANNAADAIPVVGPFARQMENDASKHGVLASLLGGGVDAGSAALLSKGVGALAPESNVIGQNYSPSNAASFEGFTGKATGMGKNFIPQDITPQALSPIRDTVAKLASSSDPALRAIADSVTSKTTAPLDRVNALDSVIQKSLDNLESIHKPILDTSAAAPVDTSALVQGLKAKMSPLLGDADNAAIQDLIDRTGNVKTVGDLGKFRQVLNLENSPEFRQSQIQAGRSGHATQASSDLLGNVRSQYYNELQNITGQDMQPLKIQESNLLTAKEALQNQRSGLAKSEAEFNAPTSIRDKVGNFAEVIKSPKQVVSQRLLRQSPASPVSEYIRKSLTNLTPP